jgi:ubiquinol-cytochrome c reductase cytochrome b subunit
VTAGTQPDWYIGWLDGALRLMPNWETVFLGFTISWNVFIPAVVIPGILFTGLALYPFLEAWATGDKREHHLLDRPRNAPVRTGIGVMAIVFYGILWLAGGNDLMATAFDLSINAISRTLQISLIVAPPIAFLITKRTCLALQRRDRDKLLHGYESGRVLRLPHGEFIEVHQPLNEKELAVISSKPDYPVLPAPHKADIDGVRNPSYRKDMLRHKLSAFFYGDNIPKPSAVEIEAGQHHAQEQAAIEAPMHEYEDRDVIFNAHGGVLHHPGMPKTNAEQVAEQETRT